MDLETAGRLLDGLTRDWSIAVCRAPASAGVALSYLVWNGTRSWHGMTLAEAVERALETTRAAGPDTPAALVS
jgi:hypothetical protein